mmetsp:Transcript_76909/g.135494  ORF Transcript_76909/g.135494 Transcript_76909/m.135494 type:complete len:502 (+) Transcript_76909:113-1618(+)|eukprot:CAMPEP_0197642570 /NCGR_PEP_ID=MMETSP1338-20131121/16192_1 /TAXON_ID=43686 ORGANISM="Pelagodinium beii, Strain RCC1491" /NCGR_SAMPLE_ID=MMETSP1338 /ASSEMBLY_ACC=CAM_ASM_000754 /LENGTH=501 /DNA_ID=CAMNT_0043215711 /DNA_START=959 /DNA_END=2464 /DNA_ORIENTATION=-
MGRLKATAALQAALVRQFGPSARSTVEEEVDNRLAGRKKLTREDLDAIEEGVVSKLRSRRFSEEAPGADAAGLTRVQTAPSGLQGLQGSSQRSRPGTTQAGLAATRRSGQLAVLQRTPLLKPVDCFDLWAEYDTVRHLQDEQEKKQQAKEKGRLVKEGLDRQMEEVRALRQQEADEKQRIRDEMLAKAKAAAEAEQGEMRKQQELKELRRQASLELLATAQRKKNEEAVLKSRERDAFDRTLVLEENMKNKEIGEVKQARAKRTSFARNQFEMSFIHNGQRKRDAREADVKMAEEWAIAASRPTASELPGGPTFKVAEGKARVEKLVDSMGKPLIAAQMAKEKDFDTRVEKQRRAFEKKRVDDYFKEEHELAEKVSEMVQTWGKQVQGAIGKDDHEKEADAKQAALWRKDALDYQNQERAKAEGARNARKDVDENVFDAMMQKAAVHKSEKGVTEKFKQREMVYNRPLIEEMAVKGFHPEKSSTMLLKASAAKLDLSASRR